MTLVQRITRVLIGLGMLAVAVMFLSMPANEAYTIVIYVLATGLTIRGIKDITFYFTMARHMVGGKLILFQGVIILDFAFFTASLSDVPKIYILMYLLAIHAFSGVVEILRAMEARKTVDGPWKLKFSHGVINIALALSCLVFIRHSKTALIIYSIGLAYSAAIRILSAFRRTAFIVIE